MIVQSGSASATNTKERAMEKADIFLGMAFQADIF